MSRLDFPGPEALSAAQRAVYDSITSSRGARLKRPDGGLMGPFNAWLRNPELAQPAQQLGAVCRYGTSLPARLSELAIVLTARQWLAQFGWAHARLAQEAGVAPAVLEAIREGRQPAFERDDEALVYEFTTALYRTRRVPDPLYRRAVAALGEQAVVELTAVLGYYALVSMTLNVFEAPLPDGVAPPLPEPG